MHYKKVSNAKFLVLFFVFQAMQILLNFNIAYQKLSASLRCEGWEGIPVLSKLVLIW